MKPFNEKILSFLHFFLRGYERLELFVTLYASLIVSLLLNVCLNQEYLTDWIIACIVLLVVGLIITIKSSIRVKNYKRDYDVNDLIKIDLGTYIKNKEEEKESKKIIQFQYFTIHFFLLIAVLFLFNAGWEITEKRRMMGESLHNIEKNTHLIDSLLQQTNSIYEQNVLLMDSLMESKKELEKLIKSTH